MKNNYEILLQKIRDKDNEIYKLNGEIKNFNNEKINLSIN